MLLNRLPTLQEKYSEIELKRRYWTVAIHSPVASREIMLTEGLELISEQEVQGDHNPVERGCHWARKYNINLSEDGKNPQVQPTQQFDMFLKEKENAIELKHIKSRGRQQKMSGVDAEYFPG